MSIEKIRRIGFTKDLLGESPCWDKGDGNTSGVVSWIDSLAGTIWRYSPGSGVTERHELPAPIGSIALCLDGNLVVALKNSFALYNVKARTLEILGVIDIAHPDVRLNDGKCDPFGNFIAGTMHINRLPGEPALGGLYRLRTNATIERIGESFGLTNGPCFSLDGQTLYVADSNVRTIWAFDYSTDAPLTNQRAFVLTDGFGSGPDGATIDSQGYLWTVLTRAAKLARFAPDGTLDRLVAMPCTHPTSLCFGGPGLSKAWVTSISKSTHLSGPLEQDGGLFEVTGLPVAGILPHRFMSSLAAPLSQNLEKLVP
jgi:L-arabinonolactonase